MTNGLRYNGAPMEDAIIVGGGHVGLYTASQLAQRGFRTLLLDQKKAIGERIVCTGIIGPEAFQRFDLPKDTILGKIRKVRFFSPLGTFFDYLPPDPLAYIVDRPRFNQHFEHKALCRGARIQTGARVEEIEVEPEKVRVKTSEGEGVSRAYECKVLILATGVGSRLFKSAGLEVPAAFLGGAQIHVPFEGEDSTLVYAGRKVAPGAFAWIVPLDTGVARVGLLSRENPIFYLKKFLDQRIPDWRDRTGEAAMDVRPVVDLPLKRSYNHRVLVVGEAAGQIKTTTAGGIYYGLLGSEIAVQTLEKSFHAGSFTAESLRPYEEKWKSLLGEELRFGYYCRRIFMKFTDEHIEELFSAERLREEILKLVYQKAEFDWHKHLMFSIFKLPSLLGHALKHPVISSELFLSLLFGRI